MMGLLLLRHAISTSFALGKQLAEVGELQHFG